MPGELERILSLPTVHYSSRGWGRALRRHPAAPPLFPEQEAFLALCAHAAEQPADPVQGGPGAFGVMSCGSGKTLALQLAPWVFGAARRSLLLTEANLVPQLERAIAEWDRHYRLAKPEVLTYGKLSHPHYADVLERFSPTLILADEAHRVGAPNAGRRLDRGGAGYKRLFRYLEAHPEVRFIAVTGSMLKRSIYSMWRLAALSLRQWSPLPYNSIIEQWASVLDHGGEPSEIDIDAFAPVQRWAGMKASSSKAAARRAFRARLESCPGVLLTTGPLQVDVNLSIQMVEPRPAAALDLFEGSWELPDGQYLVDSLEVARHRRTMRLGFWYRWDPATVDEPWVEARGRWLKVVRDHIEYGTFDSPYFVEQAAELGRLSASALRTWEHWKATRKRFTPPETEAVWYDEERLGDLVREFWREHREGIVWLKSAAAFDYLEARGVPCFRAGGQPPRGGAAAVSLAYAKGWEGQAYSRAFVIEPPSGADRMEQLLARHHRKRQVHDVEFYLLGVEKERWVLTSHAQALKDLTETPQRLLLADWPEGG